MSYRFLFALIALFSLAEATQPAEAFPVPAIAFVKGTADVSGLFILVRKGKGHGDGEERSERHHRHDAHRSSRYRRHSHGFHSNQGFGNYSGSGGGN